MVSLVVFHHQHSIAQIAHPLQRFDEAGVIPLVQADARLIQNIEDAHQLAADLRSQANALGLAAGEGDGGCG